MRTFLIRAGLTGTVAAAMLAAGLPAAYALPAPATLYVSPAGGGTGTSCASAGYSTIQAAVDAAPRGGTVVVCKGTYAESVTITKSLTLAGRYGSVINAKGLPYGVGMTASWVTVTGLTVKNAMASDSAPGDGIITAGFGPTGPVPGSHEKIIGNTLVHNAGAGIDVETSSYTLVSANVSEHNGIGINVVDDFGKPAAHNRIIGNWANLNPGGCGIVLAEHSGAGIYDNVVRGNVADSNGLGSPSAPKASAGSGIIIAGGGTHGGVYNNLVQYNRFSGNGHGGIAIHIHTKGLKFSGNRLIGNVIGKNNLRTDAKDLKTTGIYIGSAAKVRVTIRGNIIRYNHYGVFTVGPVSLTGKATNTFAHVTRNFGSAKVYPAG